MNASHKLKIKKTMEVDLEKLKKAKRIFSADTDTETVDRALSLAIANAEIEEVIRESFGTLPKFSVK